MSNGNGNGVNSLNKYLKIIGIFLGIVVSGLTLLWGFDIIYATDGDVKTLDNKVDTQELLVASSIKQMMDYIDTKSAAQSLQMKNMKKSNRAEELRRSYAFNLDILLQIEVLMVQNPDDQGLRTKHGRVKAKVMQIESELRAIE